MKNPSMAKLAKMAGSNRVAMKMKMEDKAAAKMKREAAMKLKKESMANGTYTYPNLIRKSMLPE